MRSRSSLSRMTLVVGAALTLTACTGSGASRETLIETLEQRGQISQQQAQCVADAMYRGEVEVNGQTIILTEDQINSESTKSDADRDPNYDALVEASLDECGVG